MRRSVASLFATLVILIGAAPVAAGDPVQPGAPVESPSATPAVEPSAQPSASPEADPSASPDATPSADPPSSAEPTPAFQPVTSPREVVGVSRPTAPSSLTDPAASGARRYIVVLESGTDVQAASSRQVKAVGARTERTFRHALNGYTATLTTGQRSEIAADPSVAAVVPDEPIELTAQSYPTGINRIGARVSPGAKIDGVDERVDADVAIVDTGVARVADLNVAGGYNCSTSNSGSWGDVHGHGTHVAGTVGAIDNGSGVVGVAPGVRLWAVKILNNSGAGTLSMYVCGLDWIAAQRDPTDPSRPMIEAVNMSVAKDGRDDGNCGASNSDVLHAAICRVVAQDITVVAAAANDSKNAASRVPAAYDEVITVSALADTDGKPGGLGGGRCWSWGGYDSDDTFADFSNYGGDVDLIAPGKCIWSTVPGNKYQYMSGTSMAAPHVTGAAALLKSFRPDFRPGEVKEALRYLGTYNWKITSDPDSVHEPLVDVSRVGPRGDFSLSVGGPLAVGEGGGSIDVPLTIGRTGNHFERITLLVDQLPRGVRGSFDRNGLFGFDAVASTLTITVGAGLAAGPYQLRVIGLEHGVARTDTVSFTVSNDVPVAKPPLVGAQTSATLGSSTVPARISWPAAEDAGRIAAYEIQSSVDGGAWGNTITTDGTTLATTATHAIGSAYAYRVRARDGVGNWSPWATGEAGRSSLVQDGSSSIVYGSTWTKLTYEPASGGTTRYSLATSATARTTFTGRAIAIVAPRGPSRGSFRVYVDGSLAATVNLSASAGRSRQIVFSKVFAVVGTHSIELRAVGNGRIELDAFVTLR